MILEESFLLNPLTYRSPADSGNADPQASDLPEGSGPSELDTRDISEPEYQAFQQQVREKVRGRQEKQLVVYGNGRFGNATMPLFEMGFYTFPKGYTDSWSYDTYKKSLERNPRNPERSMSYSPDDFDGNVQLAQQENERLENFRQFLDKVVKAEYLVAELPSLTVDLSPGVRKADISAETDLPNDYESPPVLQLTYRYSEALAFAALQAGYSQEDLEKMGMVSEEGGFQLPTKFREKNRTKDDRIMLAYPLTAEEFAESQTSSDPKDFFAQHQAEFQQKFSQAEIFSLITHGWTGDWRMARSQDPSVETDLVEDFYANLTPEERARAVVMSRDAVGMGDNAFTDEVTLDDGFSPSDYAIEEIDLLSSMGVFHVGADDQQKSREYILTGHSMAGGKNAHIVTAFRRFMKQCPRAKKWLVEMMNPAIVSDKSTHIWADPSLNISSETALNSVARRTAAFMVSKGANFLEQNLGRHLGILYDIPESVVTTVLTEGVLLPDERNLSGLLRNHKKNSQEKRIASSATATGSVADEVVTARELQEAYEDDSIDMNLYMITGNRERMVAPPPVSDIPVFMLDGGHYLFKRRDRQRKIDTIRMTYRRLSSDAARYMNTRVLREYQGVKNHDALTFALTFANRNAPELAAAFQLRESLLKRYLQWRAQHYKDAVENEQDIADTYGVFPQEMVTQFYQENKLVVDEKIAHSDRHPELDGIDQLKSLADIEQMFRLVHLVGKEVHFEDQSQVQPLSQRNRAHLLLLFFFLSALFLSFSTRSILSA